MKKSPNVYKKSLNEGFTFIELLFVIVIMGFLVSVSLPQFRKTFYQLQLTNLSHRLSNVISYLRERSIVQGQVILLKFDNDERTYWSQIKGDKGRLKTYPVPEGITAEADKDEILFYPDGSMDKVTIKLRNKNNHDIYLTSKGVWGGVKIQASP